MSVSGVPSIPGFDVLFPSGNTNSINGSAPANNGTASNGTSNSAVSNGTANSAPNSGTANSGTSSTTPSSTTQPAGFDVLFPNGVVPGTSATKPPATSTSNSTSASSSAAAAAAQNPYQAAYNNIETWSSSYLMDSVENGAPSAAGISDYSGGESVNSFAQLNQTLAALKPLVALDAQAANGTSGSTTSSGNSGTSSSSTGSNIDSFA